MNQQYYPLNRIGILENENRDAGWGVVAEAGKDPLDER